MTTMKYLAGLGLAAAIGVAAAGTALATPIELTATSGSGTASILLPGVGSSVEYKNPDLNGWNIEFAIGDSNSPTLGLGGLTLTTETTDCVAATCSPLTIAVSDVGFMAPLGPDGLATGLSSGPVGSSNGSVTQWAYMDTGNEYFGSTDASAWTDFGGKYDSTASLLGMLTVNGLDSAFANGGVATKGPYSLTLVDQFCSNPAGAGGTCASGLSFQTGGSISAPEPGGLALFCAGLLGFALFANRRRSFNKARA